MNDRIYYSHRAEELVKRQQAVGAFVFLVVGLGIGVVLALLFAPNVGEKTRKLISDALEDGFKRGQEVILEATNQLEQEYPDLRQRIEGLLNK
jgi:gas vesicle protein